MAHVSGISMAFSAELGDLFAIDFAAESCLGTHGLIVARRISAMATGAGESFLGVNIGREFFRGHAQRLIERRVTIQAGVFGFPANGG